MDAVAASVAVVGMTLDLSHYGHANLPVAGRMAAMGAALPVARTGRCMLALADDPHPCVGPQDALTLVLRRAGLERLPGCVLHAALMLADAPPSQVFVGCMPPARASHAVAALELARLVLHGEVDRLTTDAQQMRLVYVGAPPW